MLYLDTLIFVSIPLFPLFPSGQLLDSALSVCKSSGDWRLPFFSTPCLRCSWAHKGPFWDQVMMYGPIHSGSSFPPFLCFSLMFSRSTSAPMGRTCGWCLQSYVSFWFFWAAVMLLSAFLNALSLVYKRLSICWSRTSYASSSRESRGERTSLLIGSRMCCWKSMK